jgi:hypothetical protein
MTLSREDRDARREKIRTRLERLPSERRALEAAMVAITPDFDLQVLTDTYNSHREEDINRVRVVERNFEVIHNFLTEIAKLGLELAGERRLDNMANAPRDFDALERLGVITRQQRQALIRLHDVRSGLQHWYPEMLGPEIHAAVIELLGVLTPISSRLRTWFEDELDR